MSGIMRPTPLVHNQPFDTHVWTWNPHAIHSGAGSEKKLPKFNSTFNSTIQNSILISVLLTGNIAYFYFCIKYKSESLIKLSLIFNIFVNIKLMIWNQSCIQHSGILRHICIIHTKKTRIYSYIESSIVKKMIPNHLACESPSRILKATFHKLFRFLPCCTMTHKREAWKRKEDLKSRPHEGAAGKGRCLS